MKINESFHLITITITIETNNNNTVFPKGLNFIIVQSDSFCANKDFPQTVVP